jgi:tRNA(Ile)-lysidine synthase
MANQERKTTLEQRVLRYMRKNRLVEAGQKVLVAVSGGPDSVCLLHTLFHLQSELGISLHIAHLDHQLRGEESEADARYVAEMARQLGLPAAIEKRDAAAYAGAHRLSSEEAAREVRYSFLAQTAREVGAERVAAGHTLNDQVETILLHIIRGTGTTGLGGLLPCHDMQFSGCRLTLIRPLLEVRREETEEYCAQLQLEPCLDASNLSLSPLRNRVRHELLPFLQGYNPAIFESLLRISRIARDDRAFLDRASDQAWQESVQREGRAFIFSKKAFRSLAPAMQRHLLRRTIEELLGTLKDIEARHIEEILAALSKPAGRRITLPEGLVFGIEYDRCWLGFNPQDLVPLPELNGAYDLQIPGRTVIPGWRIEAKVGPYIPGETPAGVGKTDGFSACFDMDRVGDKIIVRARRRGDRFQPLGLGRTKKVGEFMLDARIPRDWRSRVPVLSTPEQIIWVAGWRIDERVKVTSETRTVLCLRVERWTDEQRGESRENR